MLSSLVGTSQQSEPVHELIQSEMDPSGSLSNILSNLPSKDITLQYLEGLLNYEKLVYGV
jgi:hypothetical protein